MNQPDRPQTNRVTIEDLLRIKRAERPSEEFWGRFEQDLRAKQLAAIIEPRPWWIKLRLPQAARVVVRYQMPVGAAAALALGFVVVREYRPVNMISDVVVTVPVAESVQTASVVSKVVSPAETVQEPVAVVAKAVAVPVIEANPPAAIVEQAPAGPGALLAMIPWAAPPEYSEANELAQTSVLGELPQVTFAAAIEPAGEHHFEGSVEMDPILVATNAEQPVAAESEVVAQVLPVSPREARRNHILSNLVVADNSSDAANDRAVLVQAREVVANSLTDDRLYDSVRRLGMGGDRLTLKF